MASLPTIICDYCSLPVPGARESDAPAYCCYGCQLAAGITRSRGSEGRNRLTLTLLGVAIFLSMNVMVVNWMLYGQEVYNPDGDHASTVAASTVAIFRYLSMLLTAPVLVILGWPIFKNSLVTLRGRQIDADVLIILGVAAAFVLSWVNVLRESGSTYFDTVCMILVLVTTGRYLEAGAKLRATQALNELDALLPETCTLLRDGSAADVPLEQVLPGDRLRVGPGSRVPVDGVITENHSAIDEQVITGESVPLDKGPGDVAYAGTLNGDGTIHLRATAVAGGTVLAGIKDLLLEARRTRGRYQRIADRLAAVFVPGVVLLAIGVVTWGAARIGLDEALMRGLAVLLIACPCALGLATPLAVWAALSRAARRGILIRDVAALERLSQVRSVFFDKTGTLTTGSANVTQILSSPTAGTADELLARGAGIAAATHHHLAAGIVRHAREVGVTPLACASVHTTPGRGVSAVTADSGQPLYLGSAAYLSAKRLGDLALVKDPLDAVMREGQAVALIGWGDRVQGAFLFDEALRADANTVLEALRERGLHVAVLSGDHAARGQRLGETLGIPVHAPLLPAEKLAHLQAVPARDRGVLMIGDGINDAPALAAADVGIAMGCGADVTREAADICLTGSDLDAIPRLLDLSRRTVRTIRQNLAWAFAYNLVGLGLAATGRLSPIFAAVAMVLSSAIVVSNSLRLRAGEPSSAGNSATGE